MLNQSDLRKTAIAALLFLSAHAHASGWAIGGYAGFGGTGISTTQKINATDVQVERSDSPGVYGMSFERVLSDNTSFAFDHMSGFTLAPFSSGVEFTGFTYRYFYPGGVPTMQISKSNDSTLLIKKYEPWFGGSFGVARGSITRQNDLVPEVSASGVYFGGRVGIDYQIRPSIVCRSEMIFGATMPSSGFVKATMSEFGLVTGLYYIW